MSISNSIRLSLNIKDLNIKFTENCLTEEFIKDVSALVYTGVLSPDAPRSCPKCGTLNEHYSIIKNGRETSMIKLPRVSNRVTFLRLKKQRYLCRSCGQTSTAYTPIVKRKHSISQNTYHAALLKLKKKESIFDIASDLDISHTTLNNLLQELSGQFIVNKNILPQNLCFDEFKSVKGVVAKMSFIFVDAENGDIVDIVQNRQLMHLKSYFHSFSKQARYQVKTICIDMYAPYIELIRSCFPKAKIITDRFHVVQLLNRSLNSTRIHVMKEHPKMHRRLKRYWKLILKDSEALDHQNFKFFHSYKYKTTESLVVDDLLSIDHELKDTYYYYQSFLKYYRKKNIKGCLKLMSEPPANLSSQMIKTIKTLNKHQNSIVNSMKFKYSNGVIEGKNNLIKVIKRIAFGYRSYDNFRARILLISNTLVSLELK